MKRIFSILLGIFCVGLLYAQVGINTKDPQGVFHIDAQGNINGSSNGSDNVIIDNYGNMGIGTISPQKKFEIVSPTPGAIRIADTSEGTNKVLTSSVTGEATWVDIIGSWNAILTGGNLPYTNVIGNRKINFTGGSTSKPGVGDANLLNSSITVPYTGTYRLTLFGTSLSNRANGYFIAGFYNVRSNGTTMWAPHSLGSSLISLSPYVSYFSFAYLKQNDVLDLITIENTLSNANGVSNLIFFIEFVK